MTPTKYVIKEFIRSSESLDYEQTKMNPTGGHVDPTRCSNVTLGMDKKSL